MESQQDGSGSPTSEPSVPGRRRRPTFGIVLIVVGILLLAHQLFPGHADLLWPLLLIATGAWLLWKARGS